jgi:hypothetical protein
MFSWTRAAKRLNISILHVRKAEIWSILIRSHVQLLIQEKATLDFWNHTFYNLSRHGVKPVGAPDENLFPIMLHLKTLSSSIQSGTNSTRNTSSSHLQKQLTTTTTTKG